MTYFKQVFDAENLEQAKNIVITPDNNPNKFEEETQWLINFLDTHFKITSDLKILDFGCGMGRISKALIDKFKCSIKGIDISENMLKLAKEYVNNDLFCCDYSYNKCDIDLVISSFVLQHSENPEESINNIYSVMKTGAIFVLINEEQRFVPVGVTESNYVEWKNDHINVVDIMKKYFILKDKYVYYNGLPILTIWEKV